MTDDVESYREALAATPTEIDAAGELARHAAHAIDIVGLASAPWAPNFRTAVPAE